MLDVRQLTAVVVAVRVGNDDIYLGPATKFSPYGLLSWEQTGVQGMKTNKDGGVFIQTPEPKYFEARIERKAKLRLKEDGSVEGRLEVTFDGQAALTRRLNAFNDDDAGRMKDIEDEIKAWLPSTAKVEMESVAPWESATEPLRAVTKISIPDVATATGRRQLLPAGIFQMGWKRVFEHAKRVHPIYFRYPYEERDDVTVELPASIRAESLPAARNEATNFGEYQMKIERQEGMVRVERRYVINGIYFPVTYYALLRGFFDKVRAGDEEQIVLQTATAEK